MLNKVLVIELEVADEGLSLELDMVDVCLVIDTELTD